MVSDRGASFTPELSTDWEDNNAYWRALESPVEEAAAQTFDTFLKSNGQDLASSPTVPAWTCW